MTNKKQMELIVDRMHCASCALNIESSLGELEGVLSVDVNLSNNKVIVCHEPDVVSIERINEVIEDLGFNVRKDETILNIRGMHCAACVTNIEKILNNLDGVNEASVNLSSQKATISYNNSLISPEEMGEAIKELGFEYLGEDSQITSNIDDEYYEKDLKEKKNRIIIGFITSGFLMVLMFTHIHIPPLSVSMLSLIISIIPFIYVAYPILKAGFNSLSHKHLDMDVMYTMGILVAFISSLLGTFNIILNSNFMFYETAIMLASFLMLGRFLENRAKRGTSKSIKQLMGLQPKIAILLVNDEEKEILIEDIVIDDILLVKPGDKIPADGVVVDGSSYVDESMITGEPIPKSKSDGENVFAGTINQEGVLKIRAEKVGSETVLSQIIDLVEKAQGSKPPVQKIADKVVKYFIPTILLISIVSFLFWYFVLGSSLLFALTILISVLVVACPCALGLATPTAVTVGIGRAAEYGILIKDSQTLEESNFINVAIFDKTGTITEGNPEVEDVIVFNGEKLDFIQLIASLEKNSNHPIAKSIVKKSEELGLDLFSVDNFENISGKGLKGIIDGKIIIAGNKSLIEDENIPFNKGSANTSDFLEEYNKFINQGKTTIFLAYDSKIIGILTLMDKIKDNSKKTIDELKSMNILTLMLTGDNEKTANNVAETVGIDNAISEILPNEKLDKVMDIQNDGKKVLFVGDGINDAPAISGADVGVALGNGTDIAMESGDIVLIEGDLENVVAAIQFSNKVMTRIKENIFWAFAYNIILIPIAAGILYPFFGIVFRPEFAGLAMALSSVTVVSLSLTLKRYIPPIKKSAN